MIFGELEGLFDEFERLLDELERLFEEFERLSDEFERRVLASFDESEEVLKLYLAIYFLISLGKLRSTRT